MIIKPNKKTIIGNLNAIQYALRGLFISFKKDHSFRAAILFQIVLLILIYITKKKIKPINISLAFLSIGVELINSSSEQILDIVHPSYSPLVRDAKDTCSGFSFIFLLTFFYLQITS